MTEYKDGKSYCSACNIKLHLEQHNRENIAKESEFDQILRAAINTPPLKLKGLKEKLRKEKEEREEKILKIRTKLNLNDHHECNFLINFSFLNF
jgi:hypothetical protein